jgi:hypothetical protein
MSQNKTYRISAFLLLLERIHVLAAQHPSADGPSYEDCFQQKAAFIFVAFLSYHMSVNPPSLPPRQLQVPWIFTVRSTECTQFYLSPSITALQLLLVATFTGSSSGRAVQQNGCLTFAACCNIVVLIQLCAFIGSDCNN